MWIRLRFDISQRDLVSGMSSCCFPLPRESLQRDAEYHWSRSGRSVVCLSVRSGFDLLLGALDLPPKSEVLLTALTVPDMPCIVRQHGFMPVPVDLVGNSCTPSIDSLQRATTSHTRVLVVAHLFGTRVDMEPIISVARRRNLFVIEDCAQAYHGSEYQGHPESDAALFSFGPIKTSTALGGGVIRLRSSDLAARIRKTQSSYPLRNRRSYFRRLVKYSLFKLLCSRPLFTLIARGCRILRVDLDRVVSTAARNFPGENLLEQLRRQPSAPLLKMLLRRWYRDDGPRLSQRMDRGQQLAERLPREILLDQQRSTFNNYWVFPVLVDNQREVVELMRSRGFDATAQSRLAIVAPPADRPELEAVNSISTLSRIVFLPCYPGLPPRVVRHMARILSEATSPSTR
ncbi:MAG: DegT/DnrJ/EryC1/StrS family aminotransferase [Planctomycetota bacterium]